MVKTNVPHWGSDSDSSVAEEGGDISGDDDSDDGVKSTFETDWNTSSCSMTVVAVPEKHRKDLTLRKINQVEEMKTFFVSPKKELVDGRKATYFFWFFPKLVT